MGVQGWDPEALARLGKALPRVQGTGVEVCKDQPHMKRAERLLDGPGMDMIKSKPAMRLSRTKRTWWPSGGWLFPSPAGDVV